MAETDDRSISQLVTAPEFNDSTLTEVSHPDTTSDSGYASYKVSEATRATAFMNDFRFASQLQTNAKTIIGAINEINASGGGGGGGVSYTDATGILEAGETTITLTDDSITEDSTIDFYTDVFGVNPTSVSLETGSITLTFEAQAVDVNVKVRVW